MALNGLNAVMANCEYKTIQGIKVNQKDCACVNIFQLACQDTCTWKECDTEAKHRYILYKTCTSSARTRSHQIDESCWTFLFNLGK